MGRAHERPLDRNGGCGNGARMRASAIVFAILFAISSSRLRAEDGPICADRPGRSTSACTVPQGHWQVETGFIDTSLQKEGLEREIETVIGETTLRYGLTDHSDIEIDVSPFVSSTSRNEPSQSGFGDIIASYKHRLALDPRALDVSLMPFVKIPTAKRPLGNRKWEGGLLVPIDYTIGKSPFEINLTPELDVVADMEGNGHHLAMVQVASLGWQTSPRLNLSVEVWRQWDWDPSGTIRQLSLDGSMAYLIDQRTQLDAGLNVGLDSQTPDLEFSAGLSILF